MRFYLRLNKVSIKGRVFLLEEDMMNFPAPIDHRGELLFLGYLTVEVRRIRRNGRRDEEFRGVVHQCREQGKAVMFDVLGVQEDPQCRLDGVVVTLSWRLLSLCVHNKVDGSKEFVHTLPVGSVWVLLGIDKKNSGEVVVGCLGLEELVLGIGTVNVLGDLFL